MQTSPHAHNDKNRYKRLEESTSAIPWVLDLDTWRFTHMGEQAVELLGYPVEEWYGENFWPDHIHPDDQRWAPDYCQACSERNENHDFEYRFITADGRTIWLRDVVSVEEDETGKRSLHGFMFNINERKLVEESLQTLAISSADDDSDEFFFNCVKNLARVYGARYAFIGLLKEDQVTVRTLTVWNGDHFIDNVEYPLEGSPCHDIMREKTELIPTNAVQLYPDDGMLVQMEVDSYFGAALKKADGTPIGLVSVMDGKPMKLTEWTAPIISMFATRITMELEKRKARQHLQEINAALELRTTELEAANKELEHFAYAVSHDLRAPLRGISGFSQIMEEDYGQQLNEEGRGFLQRIKAGCLRMDDLIGALLELSRQTRGKLAPVTTDISQLAHEIIAQLREQDAERQITVHIEPEMHAHCDPRLMRAALTNLLENAWKYTAQNDAAEIHFRRPQDRPGFEITDNGVGFNRQYADKLFGAFQRLHPASDFDGTGIGLATVARIIKRHGGDVWADGEVGKGATFGFSL
jgi:PAS domain S-box-containing protein